MRVTAVIIGAGHAGMAMSRCLADRSVDHVVLERGEVANSWKTERWDSLRLLTPKWQSRLPGHAYAGPDPHGFRSMAETAGFLEQYSCTLQAPIHTHTRVHSVTATSGGYKVSTNQGLWHCEAVVMATGACNVPKVPRVAEAVPTSIRTLTPFEYRNAHQIEKGGVLVVGASATGVQIAEEIHRSGRPVTVSVGEHVRVPRTYRGRDILWWMDATEVLGDSYQEMENLDRARNLPSFQLAGTDDRRSMDLNALTDQGIRLVGRLAGIQQGKAQFAGSLPNIAALADLKLNRLLDRIDEWAEESGVTDDVDPSHRFAATRLQDRPPLGLSLTDGRIRTIVWATGFRPDYSWLDVPVFDRKGRIRHDGGAVEAPGLYLMGLPFMRTRRSSLIDGAAQDARFLSGHLAASLDADRARPRLYAAAG